jgi:FkbM family methyltransferase
VQIGLAETRDGWLFYPPKDRWIGTSLRVYQEFSPVQGQALRKFLRPEWTVVDVGANCGALTLPMASCAQKVIALEPQPFLADLLRASVAMNHLEEKIQVLNVAAGESPGTIKLPMFDYSQGENFGGVSPKNYTHGDEVPTVTLDELALSQVGFIKIDVEGMEKEVLLGAGETLERNRPLMMIEADHEDLNPALITHIRSLSYTPYWFVTPLFSPDNFAGKTENVFPDVCSFDLLCVPVGSPHVFHGLQEAFPNDGVYGGGYQMSNTVQKVL